MYEEIKKNIQKKYAVASFFLSIADRITIKRKISPMNIVEHKSIILGVPADFNIDERIKKNLEDLGFRVYLLTHSVMKMRITVKDTVIHNYKKIFKKDRSYKTEKRILNHAIREKRIYQKILNSIEKADYALVIRPDQFSEEILKLIISKANYSVAYQWDGIERFIFPKNYIQLFNRFFLFDVNDLESNPECLPTTNFYFDNISPVSKIEDDIFFIGSYLPHRMDSIEKIADILHKEGLATNINILSTNKKIIERYQSPSLNIIQKPLSFEENIQKVMSSKIIIDFTNAEHHGLSLRTFESIGYRKKLITNNALVKKYDFYNPNNIFVFEDDKYEGLADFIKIPYENLDDKIYEKYSFRNWIKYLLNIEPHIPLSLH